MNINSNYDDETCNTIESECCENNFIYKVTTNGITLKYYENIIVDLNQVDEISIKNISKGDKITFLNGKNGIGTNIRIQEKIFTLQANYNGISIYYDDKLIKL
jgi:hypothetical protein